MVPLHGTGTGLWCCYGPWRAVLPAGEIAKQQHKSVAYIDFDALLVQYLLQSISLSVNQLLILEMDTSPSESTGLTFQIETRPKTVMCAASCSSHIQRSRTGTGRNQGHLG